MQCHWLQIICVCAAIQFQFIVGNPHGYNTRSQQQNQPSGVAISNGNNNDVRYANQGADLSGGSTTDTEMQVTSYPKNGTHTKDHPVAENGNSTPRSPRHICTIFTEHYDCQIQNVHLKKGQQNVFGLDHNPQQRLTFQDSTLEYLPKSLIDAFPNVTMLNLNSLLITSIESNAFENAANLQTMYLADNRLIKIDRDAFSGANSLETLVLSKNEISLFDQYTFESNRNLLMLDLDQNQLNKLPAFTNTAYLQYLNASHNNIASVDDNHFSKLGYLKSLDVSFNQLKRLNLQHLKSNLDLVDVSSNELTDFVMPHHVSRLNARNNSLVEFVVDQQCKLVKLVLAHNRLETQPNFEVCNSLEFLDLSNNLLEAFVYKPSMANLQYLTLAHNNLFEIQLPIKTSRPFSLRVLDLSHNELSYGPSLSEFKKLEWVLLNDNYFISLKSYADQTHTNFKGYRMANNEWNCDDIKKFEYWTKDKNATLCGHHDMNVNGICCRQYSKPYNDRLNEILRGYDFHGRAYQKKCSKPVTDSNNAMTDLEEIRKAITNANSENANKLKEIETAKTNANLWKKKLDKLKMNRDRLSSSKSNVALEIEKQRQFHRVTKEGLISDKEMLERVIKFVEEKDTFNRDLLKRRGQDTESSKGLLDEKQQEIDELKQVISNLQSKQAELKVGERQMKKEKDLLEKKLNKNASNIHGGTGKISN